MADENIIFSAELSFSYLVPPLLSRSERRDWRRKLRWRRSSRARRTFWRANMAGHIPGWVEHQREVERDNAEFAARVHDAWFSEDDYDDTDPEMDPVEWECLGCKVFTYPYPGPCPGCGNPLTPYG